MNKLTQDEKMVIFLDLKRTVARIESELNFLDKLIRQVDVYPEYGTPKQWIEGVQGLVKKIDIEIMLLQRNGIEK